MKYKKAEYIIKKIKKKLNSNLFMEGSRVSEKDFTRNRKLPFTRLLCFMLTCVKHTLQKELTLFIGKISKFGNVTKSAFCQQRVKLKPEAFIDLNDILVNEFYADNDIKMWKGFRLLSVDSSTLELPSSREIIDEFGVNTEDNMVPMARISTFFDLENDIIIDGEIAPYKTDEYPLAVRHLLKRGKKDLLILDRGYGAIWFFYYLLSSAANFLIRIQHNFIPEIDKFWEEKASSKIIEISSCSKESEAQLRKFGIVFKPFSLRLIKVFLDNGEIELLATSLIDEKVYPVEIFKELYFRRWGIETNYDHLKNHIEIANFTGYSPQIIKQDFFASLFISNIQSIIIRDVQIELEEQKKDTEYPYKINKNLSLGFMKDKIINILMKDSPKYMEELKKLFLIEPVPIRNGRSNIRNKSKWKRKYFINQRRAI
jgi:hypothetical protein